jgi:hypothetical protein
MAERLTAASRFESNKDGQLRLKEESRPWPIRGFGGISPRQDKCGPHPAEDTAKSENATGLVASTIKDYTKALIDRLHSALLSLERNQGEDVSQKAALDKVLGIVGITTEIFGGPVAIEEFVDPEFPDERKVVFIAEVQGENASILKMESEWVKRVTSLKPAWDGFRLRIKRKK